MTTYEFIERAKKIHGNKYDYSKTEYVNYNTKVCIICPKHGEFWQIPGNHLRYGGCPKCSFKKMGEKRKKTTEQFIEKANAVHGDKYDYSKVKYINNIEKVCIICPEHGEFWQNPNSHLSGCKCPKCAMGNFPKRTTLEGFIEKAKEIHGDKYDYSKVVYNGIAKKVCIVCPKHGEFWQKPYSHLSGVGCPICANNQGITTEEFIKRSKSVHGNKYDYSLSEYKNNREKVIVICHKKDNNGIEHGEFTVMPHAHMQGSGCPKCKQNYRLENEVRLLLTENNIKFEEKKTFDGLKRRIPLHPDFYLPDHNIVIECQGKQHFEPVDFSGKGCDWAKQLFIINKERDKIKKEYFKKNNILMLEYTNYKKADNEKYIKTKEKLLEVILKNARRN